MAAWTIFSTNCSSVAVEVSFSGMTDLGVKAKIMKFLEGNRRKPSGPQGEQMPQRTHKRLPSETVARGHERSAVRWGGSGEPAAR